MSSKRQIKYSEKMKSAGFVSVRAWIPESKREELRSLAEKWREEYQETKGA